MYDTEKKFVDAISWRHQKKLLQHRSKKAKQTKQNKVIIHLYLINQSILFNSIIKFILINKFNKE